MIPPALYHNQRPPKLVRRPSAAFRRSYRIPAVSVNAITSKFEEGRRRAENTCSPGGPCTFFEASVGNGGGLRLGASSPICLRRQLGILAPAMTRAPLAPGPKVGQSPARRRRPAGCEACCARGSLTTCGGASGWRPHLKWGAAAGVRIAGHCRR